MAQSLGAAEKIVGRGPGGARYIYIITRLHSMTFVAINVLRPLLSSYSSNVALTLHAARVSARQLLSMEIVIGDLSRLDERYFCRKRVPSRDWIDLSILSILHNIDNASPIALPGQY